MKVVRTPFDGLNARKTLDESGPSVVLFSTPEQFPNNEVAFTSMATPNHVYQVILPVTKIGIDTVSQVILNNDKK